MGANDAHFVPDVDRLTGCHADANADTGDDIHREIDSRR
jgi:hypothetical protein